MSSSFEYETLTVKGAPWRVARVRVRTGDRNFQLAEEQARSKSVYTMPYSQAGRLRDPATKYRRQFMGCLAEIFAELFFNEMLEEYQLSGRFAVMRYDNVRTDGFKSPEGEYDIRLTDRISGTHIKAECRSSVAYNRSLIKAVEDFDIIGPYASAAKHAESYAQVYIRPLYFVDEREQKNYLPQYFEKFMRAGHLHLYIAGGCFRKDMIRKGYHKSMNQEDTQYRVVKLTDGLDAEKFKTEMAARLRRIS